MYADSFPPIIHMVSQLIVLFIECLIARRALKRAWEGDVAQAFAFVKLKAVCTVAGLA